VKKAISSSQIRFLPFLLFMHKIALRGLNILMALCFAGTPIYI